MSGWQIHTGTALALPLDNIDTDQLIPARFMSQPRADGYGGFLLHDMRRDDAGALRPDFPLNQHSPSVLVAGRNFGSGSSREAAVYALVDAGVQAVIAPSFGDIFASNAVNNGLLPAVLDAAEVRALMQVLGDAPAPVEVDLAAGTIHCAVQTYRFTLDATWRTKLIKGWDDIDLTRQHTQAIAEHRADLPGWRRPHD